MAHQLIILQLVEAHWRLMHPGWPKLLCSGGNHTHCLRS